MPKKVMKSEYNHLNLKAFKNLFRVFNYYPFSRKMVIERDDMGYHQGGHRTGSHFSGALQEAFDDYSHYLLRYGLLVRIKKGVYQIPQNKLIYAVLSGSMSKRYLYIIYIYINRRYPLNTPEMMLSTEAISKFLLDYNYNPFTGEIINKPYNHDKAVSDKIKFSIKYCDTRELLRYRSEISISEIEFSNYPLIMDLIRELREFSDDSYILNQEF